MPGFWQNAWIILLVGFVLAVGGCGETALPEKKEKKTLSSMQGGLIRWKKWAERDSARVVGRPIFLFLYSQRSFWCRDLVRRCFEDQELARAIERLTLPVWVDADQRPDLFERYSLGGIPSLVFLTPTEQWITGSTYLDPRDLTDLLRRVQILFANPERLETLEEQRAELIRRDEIYKRRNPRPLLPLDNALLLRVRDSLSAVVKRRLNPGIEGLLALTEAGVDSPLIQLAQSARRDDDGLYVLETLTDRGPIVDFEKQLGVNAALLLALAQVSQADELADVILEQFALPDDVLLAAGMTGFQDEMGQFLQDPRIYAGWNALAVSGLCAAYRQTNNARHLNAGRDIFEALKTRFVKQNGLVAHTVSADGPDLLQDQVFMIRAGLDLFEAQGQQSDLLFARDLADRVIDHFTDPAGGLRDRMPEQSVSVMPVVDRWLPSGNGVAAQVMIRLYGHTQNQVYRDAAEGILAALIGPNIDRIGYAGAINRALAMFIQRND